MAKSVMIFPSTPPEPSRWQRFVMLFKRKRTLVTEDGDVVVFKRVGRTTVILETRVNFGSLPSCTPGQIIHGPARIGSFTERRTDG